MTSSCRLNCVVANSKGCAPVGTPFFPEGGLKDPSVSSAIMDSGFLLLLSVLSGRGVRSQRSAEGSGCAHT